MDFSLDTDSANLAQTLKRFVDQELIPAEKEIEELDRVPERLMRRMREMGLFGMSLPEPYGGIGLSTVTQTVAWEELGRAHSAVRSILTTNNGIGSKAIVLAGTEEQKQTYLPRLAQGEMVGAFALTEPEAGSDASAIRTKAEPDGNLYVLNGTKHFITNGDVADLVTVLALTDPEKRGRGGITAFLVEKDTPGFRVGRIQPSMGPSGYHQTELLFEDCRVPRSSVLGEIGQGLSIALKTINFGRVTLAASAVGLARRCTEEAVSYSKMRVQFGRPIAENQAIRFMLADMATSVQTARWMIRYAAWLLDRGEKARSEAAMAKLYASEALGRVADSTVQIFGGMGYMQDLPVERMYREARLFRIVEGTSEIQRLLIANDLLSG